MQPSPSQEDAIADLTLFELGSFGHFPMHLRLVLESWRDHGTGCARAIVTNRFLEQHQFVFEGFENTEDSSVRWATLDAADETSLYALQALAEGIGEPPREGSDTRPGGLLRFYWDLVEKYGQKFPSRHILLMNLDEYLFALSSGRRAPADFSGIFFRPDFFYSADFPETSFRRRVFNGLNKQLILRTLNHPQLRVAFFLDPWVANSLQGQGTAQVSCLLEPVNLPTRLPTPAEREEIKSRLGVPADRKLFLLSGDINGRKGVWRLLESIAQLTPEESARICLAIVGRAEAAFEQRLVPQLEAVAASTQVAFIRRAEYVDDGELSDWFIAADVVLVPYIHHVRVSGILLLAAAHRKPVISAVQGPLGKLTRKYRLGVTVDPNEPEELARAMVSFLDETPPAGWDPEIAYAYAAERSADKFGGRLLAALRPFWSSRASCHQT
jgi:glycosyltransferase involved in cell wall biosynthesis